MAAPSLLSKLRDDSLDWPVARVAVIEDLAYRYRQNHELVVPDADDSSRTRGYIAAMGGANSAAAFVAGSHSYSRTRVVETDRSNVRLACTVGEHGNVVITCTRDGDTWASEFTSPTVVRDATGEFVPRDVPSGDDYGSPADAILAGGAALRVQLVTEMIVGTWSREAVARDPAAVKWLAVAIAKLPPLTANFVSGAERRSDGNWLITLDVQLDEPTGLISITVTLVPSSEVEDSFREQPTEMLVAVLFSLLAMHGSRYDLHDPELRRIVGSDAIPGPARRAHRDPRRRVWKPKINGAKRYRICYQRYADDEVMDLHRFLDRIDYRRVVHAHAVLRDRGQLLEALIPISV